MRADQQLDAAGRLRHVDLVQAELEVEQVKGPICLAPCPRGEVGRAIDEHAASDTGRREPASRVRQEADRSLDRILRGEAGWQEAIAGALATATRPIQPDPRFMPRGVPGAPPLRRYDRATFPPARPAATLLLVYPGPDGELTIPLTVRHRRPARAPRRDLAPRRDGRCRRPVPRGGRPPRGGGGDRRCPVERDDRRPARRGVDPGQQLRAAARSWGRRRRGPTSTPTPTRWRRSWSCPCGR